MRLILIYFFSWIWTSPIPCGMIVNPKIIVRQDIVEVLKSNDEVIDSNSMISCVKNIVRGWFIDKKRIPVLVPEFLDHSELSISLFTELQKEFCTYSVANNFSNADNYQNSHNSIVVIRNSTDLDAIGDLNQLCAPRCSYVLCILDIYKDESSFLKEADAVVKAMWKMWIIKAVMVGSVGGKFMVVGTYSFEPESYKIPKKPEVLGECDSLGTKPNKLIFHKLKMNNCQVNVTFFDCPPYAISSEKNGEEVIAGVEGEMFEAVAESLHISLVRLNISRNDNDTNSSETAYNTILDILDYPEESDVVFCGLYLSTSDKLEYSIPYEMEKVVWLVPSTPSLSLLGLVTPFEYQVWIAIIGLLVLTGMIKILLFKKLSFLTILALIIGVSLPRQPTTLSNRIQFLAFVLFGYIITQSYLASLAGQLMNTNYQTIETIEELEKSGMKFGGTARHRNLFKVNEDPVSQKMYNKYQVLSVAEYDETMAEVMSGKNTSMALVTQVNISRVEMRRGTYDPHQLNEVLAAYPISFAVWKGLPYLDQINSKVSRLTEGGLVTHWSLTYTNNFSSSSVKTAVSRELDILHLSPSFLLLLLGHALSLIVFLIEIGIHVKKTNRFTRKIRKIKLKLK